MVQKNVARARKFAIFKKDQGGTAGAVENSGKLMAREMRPTTAGQIGCGGESVMGAAGVSLDKKPWPDL
jgi:hypothetical protein